MTFEQIKERVVEIREAMKDENADISALQTEANELMERKKEIIAEIAAKKAEAEERKQAMDAITRGEGTVIETIPKGEKTMTVEEIRNSKEYINAYAEYIKTGKDDECRSLLSENATNGTVPVPEIVDGFIRTAWEKDGIMSRVRKAYLKGNLKVSFEISATGATQHNEGVEVSEETLVLGIRDLTPKSIKKWIGITDEALDLSGSEFLAYIYDELSYQIAKKAADVLVADIIACGTVSTTTCPGVPVVTATTISVGLVAQALGNISDQAQQPVVMMNKATWSSFKSAQYAASYAVDPFEGLDVVFNNTIKSFTAASTGDTFMIVGDLGYGALANYPNGNEIQFKFDDTTLATSDIVRVIGREFVGIGVVAPDAFVKVTK